MEIAITGSTGLIGTAFVDALRERDDHPIRVTRGRGPAGDDTIHWDPAAGEIDADAFEGIDAVVHLAGEFIGKRWNAERKARIYESRATGTLLLAEALAGLDRPPRTLLSASAIGYYGVSGGDVALTETSPAGAGFMADVCTAWEASTKPAANAGIRVANMRSGLILTRRGGLMSRILLPFRLGVGGPIGDGSQYWSWITLDDEIAAMLFMLETDSVSGPVNLTAPNPVPNREFTKVLGHVLKRPAVIPVPAPALRLVFGREMADETVIGGARVLPEVLTEAGFEFATPELEPALRAVLDKPRS